MCPVRTLRSALPVSDLSTHPPQLPPPVLQVPAAASAEPDVPRHHRRRAARAGAAARRGGGARRWGSRSWKLGASRAAVVGRKQREELAQGGFADALHTSPRGRRRRGDESWLIWVWPCVSSGPQELRIGGSTTSSDDYLNSTLCMSVRKSGREATSTKCPRTWGSPTAETGVTTDERARTTLRVDF